MGVAVWVHLMSVIMGAFVMGAFVMGPLGRRGNGPGMCLPRGWMGGWTAGMTLSRDDCSGCGQRKQTVRPVKGICTIHLYHICSCSDRRERERKREKGRESCTAWHMKGLWQHWAMAAWLRYGAWQISTTAGMVSDHQQQQQRQSFPLRPMRSDDVPCTIPIYGKHQIGGFLV